VKDGWQVKSLGDVCEFIGRGTSPKYVAEGGIQVLNQRCVRDHRVLVGDARRHDDRAKPVAQVRLLKTGDVLVNSTGVGTLGRVAQVHSALPEPTTVDSHVSIVRPYPGLFSGRFFGYAMQSIEADLKLAGQGSGGQTELSRDALNLNPPGRGVG
jgi:type I restriction enzyme S subunit